MNDVVLGLVKKTQRIIALLCFALLVACTEPLSIIKPLDLSRADQVVSSEFEVKKPGGYRAALYFVTGKGDFGSIKSTMGRDKRELLGNLSEPGILIPVNFKLLKDGQVFFDERIVTDGTCCYQKFAYEGEMLSAEIRVIWFFYLLPGKYKFEVRTLEGVERFRDMESYMRFSFFKRKR